MQLGGEFIWSECSLSLSTVVAIAVGYLLLVFVLVQSRNTSVAFLKGSKLGNYIISLHNLILSLGSFVMFAICLLEIIRRIKYDGYVWLLCESQSTASQGPLFFSSYLYHISKYYELLDTILQLISGKIPPNFGLHVYHHAVIMIMTWLWLEESGSLQFIGILFNTSVHVIMYYYYYLKSIGISPHWKSNVTRFQIIQFVVSLIAFCLTVYYHFFKQANCKGMKSVALSIAFNATLLVGFVSILRQPRRKPE